MQEIQSYICKKYSASPNLKASCQLVRSFAQRLHTCCLMNAEEELSQLRVMQFK